MSVGILAAQDGPRPAEPELASVLWNERPSDVAELVALSKLIVEAEVSEITPGPDLYPVGDPDKQSPDYAVPTQRVKVDVVRQLTGAPLGPDTSLSIFKTASEDAYLEGDPPYAVGERYILFLRPKQDDPKTLIPVAPDGRIGFTKTGAEVAIAGPIADQINAISPAALAALISADLPPTPTAAQQGQSSASGPLKGAQ